MNFISNANDKAKQLLAEKATTEIFEAVVDAVKKGTEVVFATNFQNYVTRLGIILSNCITDIRMETNTYLGSIDYICEKVLGSSQMRKLMRAIEVNELGNYGKHSLHNIRISIDECLHQYNNMVRAIIQTTGLDAFNICYISNGETMPENRGDAPKVDQKKEAAPAPAPAPEKKKKAIHLLKREPSHSYGCIAGVKYEFVFLEDYDVDPYYRKVKANIDLVLPGANQGKVLSVAFKSKRGKELDRLERIALRTPDTYHFEVTIGENELAGERAVVICELWVEEINKVGILKKPQYDEVARERVELSQKLDD